MTDVLVRRVRLRGGPRRLAAVAAHALPDALDEALADLDDVELGTLTVHLDLDAAGLDDATLARLWAEQIRTAALAAGARVVPRSRRAVAPTARAAEAATMRDDAQDPASADPVEAAARAAQAWLDAGADRRAVPRELAALVGPEPLRAVLALLPQTTARRLVRALGAPEAPRPGRAERGSSTADTPGRAAGNPTPAADDEPPAAQRRRTVEDALGRAFAPPGPGSLLEAAALAADAARPGSRPPHLDLSLVTRAGGLVLLYPWLTMLCRTATEHHPGDDEVTVRRLALARLVDPDQPELADDPLVSWLAGADPERPGTPSTHLRLTHPGPVDAEAERVLVAFAGLLPGFTGSSPGYVRSGWVQRTGVLTLEPHVQLVAATAPLDVALQALPYPVALLRLPWTTALQVRFR